VPLTKLLGKSRIHVEDGERLDFETGRRPILIMYATSRCFGVYQSKMNHIMVNSCGILDCRTYVLATIVEISGIFTKCIPPVYSTFDFKPILEPFDLHLCYQEGGLIDAGTYTPTSLKTTKASYAAMV
jgi:hypothetical protein